MRGSIPWVALNVLFLLAFIFSVIVQLNDPDPVRWVLIYAFAAFACALELLRRSHWILPAALAVASLAWAATLAPRVIGKVRFADLFAEFEMKNLAIEEAREMWGLVIIAVWMVVLVVAALRLSRGVA
jgi:hypothetical protein